MELLTLNNSEPVSKDQLLVIKKGDWLKESQHILKSSPCYTCDDLGINKLITKCIGENRNVVVFCHGFNKETLFYDFNHYHLEDF